jgi:hypothetical protein
VTPNGYYILYYIDENINFNLPVAHSTEIKRLQLSGHLHPGKLEITSKGKEFLIEAAKLNIRTTKQIMDSLGDDFSDNILKYRELFPKGAVAGRTLRSSSQDISQRMKWFMQTYPQYTWENILNATENYLKNLNENGKMEYCKTASYFIKKDDKNKMTVSSLAEWCEAEIDQEPEPENPIALFNKLL